jgi:hypothetical protein
MLGVLTAVMAVGGLLGDVIGTSSKEDEQEQAAQLQIQALQRQEQEARMQSADQATMRNQQVQSVLSSQVANAAARGMALNSGALLAQSTGSLQDFAEDNKIAHLNLQNKLNSMNDEISAINQSKNAAVAQDWMDVGKTAFESIPALIPGGSGGLGKEDDVTEPKQTMNYDSFLDANSGYGTGRWESTQW